MSKKQISLIAGLVLAIILSGIFFVANNTSKKNLQKEKIKSESLLSEKLTLDKSLEKTKKDLDQMKGRNVELDKKINSLTEKILQKEAEVKKLTSENASLKSLKTKVKELENLRDKLNVELDALKLANNNLKIENQKIMDQLALVNKEKEEIIESNLLLNALSGNNYRIEAVRGKKDKLTVNGKRTQKLMVTFDLPKDIGNNINYKLVSPDGTKFESKNNKSASVTSVESSDNFYAGTEGIEKIGTKHVGMMFKPTEKLGKQIYTFDIYDGEMYIGSTQVRLK